MTSLQRGWLIVALILLGLGEWTWASLHVFSRMTQMANTRIAQVKAAAPPPLAGKGHLFSRAEVYAFLDKARQAEAIKDPLQRCLAYPDPPGSHWSVATVKAYCHYRMQPLMTFAQMQALIQNGHAAELDRKLQALLDASATQPDALGLFDHLFEQDFVGSFAIRPTLDAWKRDSPHSAFAYAASGYAYYKMAFRARGTAYMRDTPASNIESMDRLLQQADTDLRRAIALDPRVTPAYVAMIDAGGLSLGDRYVREATRRGLAVAPANFAIYDALLWNAQPKWGGSLQAMVRLADQAQAHAAANPLLSLLLTKEPAYAVNVDNCDCHTAAQLARYSQVFDRVSTVQLLLSAGYASESSHHPELAVVYFSEALRFDNDLPDERLRRAFELNEFDESQWAVDDVTAMLKSAPDDERLLKVRGFSYESLNDYPHAVQDLQKALALNPVDQPALLELGNLYANITHQWDKAWDIANRAIKQFPHSPAGWILRAQIQRQQPRAGMRATVADFAARFGHDPAQQRALAWLRAQLALQEGPRYHPGPGTRAAVH